MSVATTTADTQRFWTPTAADLPQVEATAEHYWASVAEPHRTWAVAAVRMLGPVASVLDLGCQCGPNLRALHEHVPGLRLIGLDTNPHALAFGRQWLPQAEFIEGAIPGALAAWPDRSVDVVLSTYCLAYQSPETIGEALAQALRIARRALVLIEPMASPNAERLECPETGYVEWWHPYGLYLGSIVAAQDRPLTLRWEPMPRYERMTGALIVLPAGER